MKTKPTKKLVQKLQKAAAEARKRVSTYGPEKRAELLRNAHKLIEEGSRNPMWTRHLSDGLKKK